MQGDELRALRLLAREWPEIKPEALARLVGWSATLEQLAQRMRCSQCGKKSAHVVAVARSRPRGARQTR